MAQPELQDTSDGGAEQRWGAPLQILRQPKVLPVQGGLVDWHLPLEVGHPERGR